MFSTLHKKTKILLVLIFLIINIVGGFVISFLVSLASPKTQVIAIEKNDVKKEEVKKEEEKKIEEKDEEKQEIFEEEKTATGNVYVSSDGVARYEVGKDLEEGLHKIIANSQEGYYRLTNGVSTDAINTEQDMVFFNFAYVDLKKGQNLYLIDATIQSEMKPYDKAEYASGQYKVGYDIPSGDYIVYPKGDIGNVKLLSSVSQDDVVFSQYIEKNANISIKDGQYIILSNVGIKK